jgi:hypothetical protein
MKLGNVEIQKQRCLNRVSTQNGSSRPSAASDLASGWFFDMRCWPCAMQIRSFKDPLSVYEYLSSLKTSNSNLFYRLLLDNLVEV